MLSALENDPRFTEFMELCTDFAMDSIMEFASDRMKEKNEVTGKYRMEAYHTFADEVQAARDKALAMVEEINAFIRYHFQDNSVFADNVVETGIYPTACSDELGVRERLTIGGGNGQLTVTDKRGQTVTIDASSSTKMVNQLTRDYVINARQHVINTSSFAVIHQISSPLSIHADTDRYDGAWTGSGARQRLKQFRQQYDTYLYKRYDDDLKH